MRTSNPALSADVFSSTPTTTPQQGMMTISGAVNKTILLLLLLLVGAGYTWSVFAKGGQAAVGTYTMVGAIGGFIVAMVTIFKKEWAPITAPIYALLEGVFIGGISSVIEASYPGIVIQAVALTFGTLAGMLFLYKSGIIQVTDKFRMGIVAATAGIAIFYLVTIALGFFGVNVPLMNGGGVWGIAFSVFVVAIAALNLVLDFDFIEQGAASKRLPQYMDWYAAFGLMVTLVWLYLEILRLLAKIRDR